MPVPVFSLPAGKTRHTTVYSSFKGVDFSSDTTKIDNARSPFAPNVISDSGGYPQKRTGWRELLSVKAPVNGLFRTVLDGTAYWLAHGGDTLYRFFPDGGQQPVVLRTGLNDGFSAGFTAGGFFYLLTGGDYLRFDGQAAVPVSEVATVPTVTNSRLPNGGGEVYESVNLLSPRRTDSFLCDGTSKDYYLSSTDIDAVTDVLYNGSSCEIDYTVDTKTGCVSFAQAPEAPLVTGQDNLRITYSKTVEGYADRIEKCRFVSQYGIGGADYWFVSGNPDYPNLDWCSALQDPTYFPDLNYAKIGGEETAVTGYARVGEYLAILKQDNAQDATILLRAVVAAQQRLVVSREAVAPRQAVALRERTHHGGVAHHRDVGVEKLQPWRFAALLAVGVDQRVAHRRRNPVVLVHRHFQAVAAVHAQLPDVLRHHRLAQRAVPPADADAVSPLLSRELVNHGVEARHDQLLGQRVKAPLEPVCLPHHAVGQAGHILARIVARVNLLVLDGHCRPPFLCPPSKGMESLRRALPGKKGVSACCALLKSA